MLEDTIKTLTSLECARMGLLIQRNNVGACQDATGRVIRFGLMNDSAKLNKRIKSSDLIGITPVTITPDMVGQTFGVYTALETKRTGWHLTPGDEHGHAQAEYHRVVIAHGGFAGFVQDPATDIKRIIRR